MDESPRSRKNSQEGPEVPRGQKRPLEDDGDAQGTVPKKARSSSSDRSDREEEDGGSGEAVKPEVDGSGSAASQQKVLECASCAAERISQKECCPLCAYERNLSARRARKQLRAIRKAKKLADEDLNRPDSPYDLECVEGGLADHLPYVQRKIWWFAYPPDNSDS